MLQTQFRVIPVLDVRSGQTVHAAGGIRSHYGPLQSLLHPSCNPLELARAYRDLLGLRELYLADLGAISERSPDLPLYRNLHSLGVHLWIDAGIKDEEDLRLFAELPDVTIVVGLETVAGPEALRAILHRTDPDRVVVSLDMFEGVPRLPEVEDWEARNRQDLARKILDLGVNRLLLLDLARVGTGRGTGTVELLSQLRTSHPVAEVSVGGGIAGIAELIALSEAGAAAALVGSALHDGRIGREQLARLREQDPSSGFTERPHQDRQAPLEESDRHSTSAD